MLVKIDEVQVGDIVNHNGVKKTVGKGDLKFNQFIGWTLFGDSYNLGYKLVEKVQ